MHSVVWAEVFTACGDTGVRKNGLQYICSLSNTGKFIQTWGAAFKDKIGLPHFLTNSVWACLLGCYHKELLNNYTSDDSLLSPSSADSSSVCMGGAAGHITTGLFNVSFRIHGSLWELYLVRSVNHSVFLYPNTVLLVGAVSTDTRKRAFGFCQKAVTIHQNEDAQLFNRYR